MKLKLKALPFLFAVATMSCMATGSWAASYYVDATAGNDSNAGTQVAPWKSIAKVNTVAFVAGDTVNFAAGQTWTGTLKPRSGSASANITYTSFGTGTRPVIDSALLNSVSYVTIKGIKFYSQASYAVNSNSMSYVTFDNCEMYNAPGNTSYAVMGISWNSHHNKVLNSTLSNLSTNVQNDCLDIYHSSYNLIEGNKILNATHYALTLEGASASYPNDTSSYNIIRNNTIQNANGANTEFQSVSNWNVIEGNVIIGGYAGSFDAAPNTMKLLGRNNIVRYNIMRDNTQTTAYGIEQIAYQYGSDPVNVSSDNRVYNNVITNIYTNPVVLDSYGPSTATVSGNVYKNNIIYNNGTSNGVQMITSTSSYVSNNYFNNNLFYSSITNNVLRIKNVSQSVSTAQTNDPSHFSGNLQTAPLLDTNYKPTSGSPCIGAGAFLTTVTSASGSGSALTVADATYFSDGHGLIPGDTIQIGSITATIRSIDYSKNTITLTSSVAWQSGAPVSMPYGGSKPTIGAYQLSKTLSAPDPVSVN